ncbi:MAG: peptidoglycan DD-metalloendopeptidase family protein [Desulfobacula sp.]|nr:peptidoglycan DD-metalloendopeptidase family protein [Desulfobacula sp.]
MLSFFKTNIKIALVPIGRIGLVGLVGLSFLWPEVASAQKPVLYKGVINSFKLNIRQSPSRHSDVVIVVEKNQQVDVIEKKGGIGSWLTVIYKGKKGYIRNRSQYIRLVPAVPIKMDKSIKKSVKPGKKLQKKLEKKTAGKSEKKIEKKLTKKTVRKVEKAQKKEIKKKIQTQEKMVETFSQKEVEIIEGLNEIDYALNKARIKVSALSIESMQLEAGIQTLSKDITRLAADIALSRRYAGRRLKALYKMNMIGRLDAAGRPASVFDFFLQQNSMKRILFSDFKMLEKQSRDLEKFESLEGELKKEIQAKNLLEDDLNDQIRINKKETLKREMILREIRKKKKLSLAAVESLKNSEQQLDNRINSLQKGQIVNTSSFSNYKGRLNPPVRGRIISRYGPASTGDYKSFTFQKGIDIKVERGEPVKSVFKGEIMFAQWLKGYGNLLIINHGDNYYTLYAHVEEIFKQQGERVETGEVVATAGDTGSIKGMNLHFEIRHHGKPVNPMKWLRKGA